MTSNSTTTTSFPLGLFCTATLSGPLPDMRKRTSPAIQSKSPAPLVEPLTDKELNELADDLCPEDKST